MAKTASVNTLSPKVFVSGAPIYHEHWATIAEQANYAALHPVTHLGLCTSRQDWDGAKTELGGTHYIEITDSVFQTLYQFNIYSRAEVVNFDVGAEVFQGTSTTAELRWTIGATAAFTQATFTNAVEKESSVANAANGTDGWQLVTIEGRRATGTNECYLYTLRLNDEIIAATALADPENS